MATKKSKALLWLQLIIAIIVITWLTYDFFFTVTQGVTYKIRLNDILDVREYPFVFFVTVGIKLFLYWFFIWLLRGNLKKLKE